ncbi:hypothetical protein [Nitrosomonas halophila]|uniref:Uncharacterized protein n=1 Tax=Nitrosomonas halophila TaxID=44576 RepID=A0A1H3FEE0_9PROT|nr:hypothetical protein [Nitrosomonas halophila]SDX88544.1 hypothetical protein SAMN05421881_101149 [Nitrosomonas halophila]
MNETLTRNGLTTGQQNARNAAKAKRSPLERARDNPRSVKLAVAAYCYHTCKAQTASNSHLTKRAIKNCEKTDCPLWPHRGFQTPAK